jgi:sugar phosphate permease
VKEYGWPAYFNTLIGACALALLLLSPMMNLKSFVQRREIYMQRKLKGQ